MLNHHTIIHLLTLTLLRCSFNTLLWVYIINLTLGILLWNVLIGPITLKITDKDKVDDISCQIWSNEKQIMQLEIIQSCRWGCFDSVVECFFRWPFFKHSVLIQEPVWPQWAAGFTLPEVRFTASAQNGIKLRLVRADFILSCGVQFLQQRTSRACSADQKTHERYIIRLFKQIFPPTWASCLAREMSTVSLSSRLPWKQIMQTISSKQWFHFLFWIGNWYFVLICSSAVIN